MGYHLFFMQMVYRAISIADSPDGVIYATTLNYVVE